MDKFTIIFNTKGYYKNESEFDENKIRYFGRNNV